MMANYTIETERDNLFFVAQYVATQTALLKGNTSEYAGSLRINAGALRNYDTLSNLCLNLTARTLEISVKSSAERFS